MTQTILPLDLHGMILYPKFGHCCTSESGGGALGARAPLPPDLEAPVIQFGGPVYNLRAKQ